MPKGVYGETYYFLKDMIPKVGVSECARILGRSKTSVISQAIKEGLYSSSNRVANHKFENNVDATFFDTWNEFSSYVYGFFVTDGCVSQNSRVLNCMSENYTNLPNTVLY